MVNLLQSIWDQYAVMTRKVDGLIDDQPVDEEPFKSLCEIVNDTEEMAKLRTRLYEAGVQNIGGKHYPANQPLEADAQGEKTNKIEDISENNIAIDDYPY